MKTLIVLILFVFLNNNFLVTGQPSGCAPGITGNQTFGECVMGYSILISTAASFVDINDTDTMMAIVCSTEGTTAIQCVLEYVGSCPNLTDSWDSSPMLQSLQAVEQSGGLESYCNTSVTGQPSGCALNITGNQSFIECVMGYSMFISNTFSSMDRNDLNATAAVMCSTEWKAALQCLVDYATSCPDVIHSGNNSAMLQSLQDVEQLGGLETLCNITSVTGQPSRCAPGIMGNQTYRECVMGYSILISTAAGFVDINDTDTMMAIVCSTEGTTAIQCVLEYVGSCPNLTDSWDSSPMLQSLQAVEQSGGLESYCNTSVIGQPSGCALDITGNQSFIECVMGYSMFISNTFSSMDRDDLNATADVMCSTEGKAALQCLVDYATSCPDVIHSGNNSAMLQSLQDVEQLGGLETLCNITSDDCTDGTDNCSENAVCTSTPGGFKCICDATKGFYGDGTYCSKIICNPDNSINIYNLPSNYHYFAMQSVAGQQDIKCTVTDINSTAVIITGCAKDLPILLTIGTYSGMEAHAVHGGKSVMIVMIKCNEIPETGDIHSVKNTLIANLRVDEKAYTKPSYEVTSALNPTTATVGSPVGWTINFPREYILEVTECNAFPGTSNTSSQYITLITNGGCNATSELISHFTDNMDGTATATIVAFKFYDHDNVFLTCDLKICPSSSSSCNTACSRSKRSVEQIRDVSENDATVAHTATVHNLLEIVGPFASASALVSEWLILTLTCMNRCL